MDHEYWMRLALSEARRAYALGEVPVGCVIVREGDLLSSAHNEREANNDPLGHAEMLAISRACAAVGNWRLTGCTLYVTLEPCLMCAGAILNSRIPMVVFGARDTAAGALGGVIDVFSEGFKPWPAVIGNVLADDCASILEEFFKNTRKK
ncbi:MAG: tRNA adenosine(34) deaminase TadA [Oscillospiraceae bacterium]|jgi:tRNA(adenine34) deaminase